MNVQSTIRLASILFICACFFFTETPHLNAQYKEQIKLLSEFREGRAEYGTAVDISGDYAIVSASRENIAAGAAYIYKYSSDEGWEYYQRLTSPDAHEMMEYGSAVKFGKGFLVVAAGREDIGGAIRAGALYIYELKSDTFTLRQKLVTSDFSGDAHLGAYPETLETFDNAIVVGSSGKNGHQGAIYYFMRNSDGDWQEEQIIDAPERQSDVGFGRAVSIDGNTMVVGALNMDNRKGKVFLYSNEEDINRWRLVSELSPSDGTSDLFFGKAVSIEGNYVAVGANAEGNNNSLAAAVYIYEKDDNGEWSESQKISTYDAGEQTYFGWSCMLNNSKLYISAPHIYGYLPGNVMVYIQNEENQWELDEYLETRDNREQDFFGWDIAVDGNRLIVGSPRHGFDENGEDEIPDSGAAYIFHSEEATAVDFIESFDTEFLVYPNPTQGTTFLQSEKSIASWELFNAGGQLLLRSQGEVIHFDNQSSGTYFLRITLDTGETVVRKILKIK